MIGIHFFNPVPVLSLVELVPSLLTARDTTERARAFVQDALGKRAIDCQDRAGFVVNALLIPFILSAIRMMESGFATAEDIDEGLVRGAAHPQGPLALADLIGLDTTKAVAESLYEEFKEPLYAPPPLLARMVDGRPARPQDRPRLLHLPEVALPRPSARPTVRPKDSSMTNPDFDRYRLSEDHRELRDAVRRVAEDKIAPYAAEVDEHSSFPQAAYDALVASDFHAPHVPEEYDGVGADALATCVVIEEIARVCASSSLIPAVNKLGSLPLILGGSDDLKRRYLPPLASGAAGVLLRPVRTRRGQRHRLDAHPRTG